MPSIERKAKKSLGQHFLRDDNICRRIVELARIEPEDQVMEIGPGPGAITGLIRQAPKRCLLLLEKDDFYASEHQKAADLHPETEFVRHMDAMNFPWQDLQGNWIVMGNLPYNVASPLMWDIVSQVPHLKRSVFMIQKEVADRILAAPGSRAYGGLTAWLANWVRPTRGFNLGPGAFSPPPKVDSTVIVLAPLAEAEKPGNPRKLAQLIKISFSQRRKQLGTIYKRNFPGRFEPAMLERLGIDPQARPETLTPLQFRKISESFESIL